MVYKKEHHEIIHHVESLPVYFSIYETCNSLVSTHWHTHLEILYIFDGSMLVIRNEEFISLWGLWL